MAAAAILDDRKSLLIAFLAISDQNATLIFFHKITAGGHFGWPKIAIDRISRHFREISNFEFFSTKWLGGHFGWPIAFLAISNQYSIFYFFMTKNHFRSHFSPFQINTQLLFFSQNGCSGHFGWPKITFDRISRHFRSIRNFDFFSQNGCWRPFWMTENRYRSHFSPFQINTQLFFFFFFSKWPPAAILEVRFAPKTIGFFHYVLSMAMPNMKSIGEFVTQLEMPQAFGAFLYKMATRGHFVFPIDDKNHRVLVIWDLNGNGEYELNRRICDKVMACTSVGVPRWRRQRRRRRRRRRRNQKHNITEIFKFRGYNNKDKLLMFLKMCTILLFGSPWGTSNSQIKPILLPSYPLSNINLYVKYGCNLISTSWFNARMHVSVVI